MGLGHFDDEFGRVYGCDSCSVGKSGGRRGKDASPTTNVEIRECLWGRGVRGGQAESDEVMSQGVHEVQKPRWTMGVPPCRR